MKTLIKKQFISLVAIIAAIFGNTSCIDNKFDFPIEDLYNHGLTANINIADLKAKYTNSTVQITQDLIVAGYVCSSDKEGNIFKTLYIQDETGGLPIVIDQTNINNGFRTGRKVFIKLKGLYLGSYSGLIQLGMMPEAGESSPSRIPATAVSTYIVKDYEVKDIEPEVITIAQLPNRDDLIGKLIKINDVQFTTPDATYAAADANTNRAIEDKDGNTVILRNSSYSTFALLPLPVGSGSLTAVLSLYSTGSAKTYQLLIRDTADVAFYSPRFGGGGGGIGNGEIILRETFGNSVAAAPWPSVADYEGYLKEGKGAAAVTYTAEGGAVSVRANAASSGYLGASGECNAMMASAGGASLLVNDIATCGATNLVLSFGSNEASAILSVAYKINGTTNWIPVTYTKTDASWGLVSATITLPAGTNTIKLRFTAATTQYGTRVDDVRITTEDQTGNPIIDPDEGGGGGGGTGEEGVILRETFGNSVAAAPWPSVADYVGYLKEGKGAAAVTYTAENGSVSVRNNSTSSGYSEASGECNAMMAAAGGASLLVNDIATCGATNLVLSFGSNEASAILSVAYKINGTTNWIPITYTKTDANWGLVSATITLPAGTNTIKLKFTAATTQYGTRVDDVKITTEDQTGNPIIDPDEGGGGGGGTGGDEIFKETCGETVPPSNPRPSPSEWTGWDNGTPVTFAGTSDIRSTGSLNTHVWFAAASASVTADETLIISGINTAGHANLKLSFDVTCNKAGGNASAFSIDVKDLDTNTETSITVPSVNIPTQNVYVNVSDLTGLPATGNLQITFRTTVTSNPEGYGYRLDNIVIYE
ncbi:MAG: DUF5689 domain-containing protein [Prevotellaceae bacterium]|nr:DUF5689 domain-containing protein [Prevotellaceae bacterium]